MPLFVNYYFLLNYTTQRQITATSFLKCHHQQLAMFVKLNIQFFCVLNGAKIVFFKHFGFFLKIFFINYNGMYMSRL